MRGVRLPPVRRARHSTSVTPRIHRRPYRVGAGESGEPEAIEELLQRREKHERLTRGAPSRAFGDVLKQRQKVLHGEEDDEEEAAADEAGAKDPLLGLDPGQSSALSNRPSGRRSGQVIVKG